MKKYPLFSVVFGLALAQVVLVSRINVFGATADCFTVILVYVSLFFNLRTALVAGVLAGGLKDIFSANPWAINTVLSPLWCFLVFQAARRLTIDSNAIRCGVVFVIALCNALALRAVWWYMGVGVPLGVSMRILIADSLLSVAAALAVFKLLRIR